MKPAQAADRPFRTMRVSVSFPSETYEELERIAAAKKVSLAWVVRDAADKYLVDQWPLLAAENRSGRVG